MIAYAFDDLVMHPGEYHYLEEWLDGAKVLECVRSNPKDMLGTDAVLGVDQIATVFHGSILFVHDHIVHVKFVCALDVTQLLYVFNLDLGDQGVLDVENNGLIAREERVLLDLIL